MDINRAKKVPVYASALSVSFELIDWSATPPKTVSRQDLGSIIETHFSDGSVERLTVDATKEGL